MIVLETKRLILRRLVMTDLDHLFALYRDPEIRRYFPEGVLDYAPSAGLTFDREVEIKGVKSAIYSIHHV